MAYYLFQDWTKERIAKFQAIGFRRETKRAILLKHIANHPDDTVAIKALKLLQE